MYVRSFKKITLLEGWGHWGRLFRGLIRKGRERERKGKKREEREGKGKEKRKEVKGKGKEKGRK